MKLKFSLSNIYELLKFFNEKPIIKRKYLLSLPDDIIKYISEFLPEYKLLMDIRKLYFIETLIHERRKLTEIFRLEVNNNNEHKIKINEIRIKEKNKKAIIKKQVLSATVIYPPSSTKLEIVSNRNNDILYYMDDLDIVKIIYSNNQIISFKFNLDHFNNIYLKFKDEIKNDIINYYNDLFTEIYNYYQIPEITNNLYYKNYVSNYAFDHHKDILIEQWLYY